MRITFALTLGLLMALASAALAAPAPLQPRDRAARAEVVFDAGSTDRVRQALIYLRSNGILDQLASSTAVTRCLPQASAAERRAWLLSRLVATGSGSQVTVQLAAGRGEDSLAILQELQRAIVGEAIVGGEAQLERLVFARKFKRWAIINENPDGDDEESVRMQFMMNPLKLARGARTLR